MGTLLLVGLGVFFALLVGLQVLVRLRARALQGKPLPAVPGPIGQKLGAAERALVYFMSPQCGACRRWTPKLTELEKRRKNVFVIDVTEHLDVARALGVMATPSTIEVEAGRVVGYHVGGVPSELLARFS